MERKPFIPQPGTNYQNQGGGVFHCVSAFEDGNGNLNAVMRNRASGWTLTAHGVGIYDDGSIDWDYSTDGYFGNADGQQGITPTQEILNNAVEIWGKAAQVDMMIEEMAELEKELLNERRGRDNHIAEEMADVQIMLRQMEIIFQNAGDVKRIFREKVDRLDRRLHGIKGAAE